MDFLNYQNQAKRITHYKISGAVFNAQNKDQIIENMGAMLYGITMLCYELNISLETVALHNLAKLRKNQRDSDRDAP